VIADKKYPELTQAKNANLPPPPTPKKTKLLARPLAILKILKYAVWVDRIALKN
jgi:hypothetical protein